MPKELAPKTRMQLRAKAPSTPAVFRSKHHGEVLAVALPETSCDANSAVRQHHQRRAGGGASRRVVCVVVRMDVVHDDAGNGARADKARCALRRHVITVRERGKTQLVVHSVLDAGQKVGPGRGVDGDGPGTFPRSVPGLVLKDQLHVGCGSRSIDADARIIRHACNGDVDQFGCLLITAQAVRKSQKFRFAKHL